MLILQLCSKAKDTHLPLALIKPISFCEERAKDCLTK